MYVHALYVLHVCHSVCAEVRGQAVGLGSSHLVGSRNDSKCLYPTCAFPAPFEAQRDGKVGETYHLLIQRDRVVLLCGGEERAETGISCTS